jgi:hypothetical protein
MKEQLNERQQEMIDSLEELFHMKFDMEEKDWVIALKIYLKRFE